MKNTNQSLQSIEELIQRSEIKLNSNLEELKMRFQRTETNLQTLTSIDSSFRKQWISTERLSDKVPVFSFNEKSKQLNKMKSFCDPIVNKLSESLRSVITDCFADFKKTIIEEKLMEAIGDNNSFKSISHLVCIELIHSFII